jgi:uncharacterized damage-inducible protein DinB
MDLLDRLLGHDADTMAYVFDLAQQLSDKQLDQDFDIGQRTVRATIRHIVRNIEGWGQLMAGASIEQQTTAGASMAALRERFELGYSRFAEAARAARDADRLNDVYLDILDQPPSEKTYGATILHVVTHDHLHRSELLHMLDRLGVGGLIEGDVLGWESNLRNSG